ncbi:hypothetical protein FIBSPDRAFT_939892 [Athelia psychrophila]|uniref:Uncharacterized protein n=1 Tax=Athelia psychrophila TaxID=1759441 RepID=A0A167X103_9AGAM|nr:hypothetical protein FIBSPDRAFT_939892 [Fibularhizoctonia sp. CBS 109695]
MHSNYPFTSVFSNPPVLGATWQSVNLIPVQFISSSTGEPIEASTQDQHTPSPASQPVWVRRKKITLNPGNLGPVSRVILRSRYTGPFKRLRGGADSGGTDSGGADSGDDDDDDDGSNFERMQLIPRGLDPASFRRQLELRARSRPQEPISGSDSDDLKRKRDEDEDEDANELASDKRPKHDLQGQPLRESFTLYDTIERETTSKVSLASPSASPSASPAARPAVSLSSPPHLGLDNSTEGSAPRRRSSRIKDQPKQTKK